MKNIILGMIGAFVLIYTLIVGLILYGNQVRYNEMDNSLAQVLKQTLEEHYQKGDDYGIEELTEDIKCRLSSDSQIEVIVHYMDLDKGIISVTIKESYQQLSGKVKTLEWSKTAIMDRSVISMPEEGGEGI